MPTKKAKSAAKARTGKEKPWEPSMPLQKPQWETFAKGLALGRQSAAKCYAVAYGIDLDSVEYQNARKTASLLLLTNGDIQERATWLRKRAAEKVTVTLADLVAFHQEVMDTAQEELELGSRICEGIDRNGFPVMPSKSAAAKEIADLLGYKKPQEVNLNVSYEPPGKALERLGGVGLDVAAILKRAGVL